MCVNVGKAYPREGKIGDEEGHGGPMIPVMERGRETGRAVIGGTRRTREWNHGGKN